MIDRIQSAFAEIHADEELIDSTAAYLRAEAEAEKLRQEGQNPQKARVFSLQRPTQGELRRRSRRFSPQRLAGACAAAMLLVFGILSFSLYSIADAYVSIDVNPSMELTLNRFGRVIDVRAYNGDGEAIIGELALKGKSYEEATELIFSTLSAAGYLSDDALISVTVHSVSSKREEGLCAGMQQLIAASVSSERPQIEVEVFPVTREDWKNARGCNMSPARYLAIQELLGVDEEATLEDYRDSSLRQIRERIQERKGALSNPNGQGQGQGGNQEKGQGPPWK